MVKIRDSSQECKRNKKDHNHYSNVSHPSGNIGGALCSLQCFGGKKTNNQLCSLIFPEVEVTD